MACGLLIHRACMPYGVRTDALWIDNGWSTDRRFAPGRATAWVPMWAQWRRVAACHRERHRTYHQAGATQQHWSAGVSLSSLGGISNPNAYTYACTHGMKKRFLRIC